MIFDMDAELQHLISLSMDKMTSGASSSTSGRANRRSRGMDLRKAVLVAHFLQDVRCAYIEENYEIVANTIKDFKAIHCEKNEDAMILSENEKDDKDLDKRCNEESRTYFMDSDSDIPSSSMYQSCVTNTDLMVSRISQVTQPLAISVNTSYVISHQYDSKDEEACVVDDDVPAFSEELEVVCEETNDTIQKPDATSSIPEMTSQSNNSTGAIKACASRTEVGTRQQTALNAETRNSDAHQKSETRTVTCPLPKKKRPLPKEFWDADCELSPSSKTPKVGPNTQTSKSCRVSNSEFVTNSFTTSVANTVILESKTSTSLSTVSSVMGTSTLPMTHSQQSNPKVVVQITQSCDSYLPIPHSKVCLEKRLSEMTVRTL